MHAHSGCLKEKLKVWKYKNSHELKEKEMKLKEFCKLYASFQQQVY